MLCQCVADGKATVVYVLKLCLADVVPWLKVLWPHVINYLWLCLDGADFFGAWGLLCAYLIYLF